MGRTTTEASTHNNSTFHFHPSRADAQIVEFVGLQGGRAASAAEPPPSSRGWGHSPAMAGRGPAVFPPQLGQTGCSLAGSRAAASRLYTPVRRTAVPPCSVLLDACAACICAAFRHSSSPEKPRAPKVDQRRRKDWSEDRKVSTTGPVQLESIWIYGGGSW